MKTFCYFSEKSLTKIIVNFSFSYGNFRFSIGDAVGFMSINVLKNDFIEICITFNGTV